MRGWEFSYRWLGCCELQEAEAQNPGRATSPLNQNERTVRTGRRIIGVAASVPDRCRLAPPGPCPQSDAVRWPPRTRALPSLAGIAASWCPTPRRSPPVGTPRQRWARASSSCERGRRWRNARSWPWSSHGPPQGSPGASLLCEDGKVYGSLHMGTRASRHDTFIFTVLSTRGGHGKDRGGRRRAGRGRAGRSREIAVTSAGGLPGRETCSTPAPCD